ncbi:MAG: cytochrome c maturation protein CcmE [Legionellaceae bacterium]|nr:cytochrome c maturation protein CcmE [Legionellaceae bacterium]
MHVLRKRRLSIILLCMGVLAVVVALVMYALRQNISLFYTPSALLKTSLPTDQMLRLGGMVEKGSLQKKAQSLDITFKVTDFQHALLVHYHGILPDLFREGQGVVVSGYSLADHSFQATEVLAKHDANYMPPQVRDALVAQNG